MDDKGRESGHLMLITPERVFYAGLLGRPRQRCSGAFHVYVAIEGGLRLSVEGGRESYGELAVVPPDVRHTIASDYRSVICVLIEPETVRAGALRCARQAPVGRGARVFRAPHSRGLRAIAAAALRRRYRQRRVRPHVFRRGAAAARLDPRVVRSIAQIGRFCGEPVTAASCAAEAGLSASRFLHLFKQETGISFRAFRAWKRARHLLHFANQDLNLAHLAQDIGYPELHPFQPLDPPVLRPEAARDLFGLARSRDLSQRADRR